MDNEIKKQQAVYLSATSFSRKKLPFDVFSWHNIIMTKLKDWHTKLNKRHYLIVFNCKWWKLKYCQLYWGEPRKVVSTGLLVDS